MSYIYFPKKNISSPEFSGNREFILAGSSGAYCSSTLINCNTRKYHGLLIVPQPQIDDNSHVLLSALDETIIRDNEKTQLATHRFPGTYNPHGYNYLEEFSQEGTPKWTIKVNDIVLTKEFSLQHDASRLLVRYTVEEAAQGFNMRFEPFLAFRSIHTLAKANVQANKKTNPAANGIKLKMYPGFSDLFLQFSKKPDFVSAPEWYYNFEYQQEKERGYEYLEDLYRPGYFDMPLKKGEQIIFTAGLTEITSRKMRSLFESELKEITPLLSFEDCLLHAAKQFIVRKPGKAEVTAGFHWFGRWGRDTFIALPGLTLSTGQPQICKEVINTMLKELKDGLFPNMGYGARTAYNSADAPLWFFWALQKYAYYNDNVAGVWKEYSTKMKSILNCFRKGTALNIKMLDSGLLYAGVPGQAVTWMDAVVDGKPVTPRIGLAVELNALWYNAICFALEAATKAGNKPFINEWSGIAERIAASFEETFWDKEKGYLADYVNGNHKDWSLRPNQVIAASLPYSPIDDGIKASLLDVVKDKLLTPRGLRTLSPDDPNYKGICFGNQRTRDNAYHQGTVWPWLLGHFAEAWLKVHGENGMYIIESIYENFAPAVKEYGIGTIAEIYDGNEPHHARGAISQAWSVAELTRINSLIRAYIKSHV